MPHAERRKAPRREVRVQLRFRSLEIGASELLSAESVNFSERGVYFTTGLPLRIGTPLELILTIPSEVSGLAPVESRCTARVVHVKPNAGPHGESGIGVYIEHFDAAGQRGY